MVNAWFMKDPVEDQFAPNHLNPQEFVSLQKLAEITGVVYRQVDVDENKQDAILEQIPEARQCNYRDVIEISPEKMGDQFHKKLAMFFEEHLHTDDEVRFILAGSGYFDVRDHDNRWIRIAMEKGDFIILPAGIYHRFTVDTGNQIKAMRLFVGEPVWTPHPRSESADHLPAREKYLELSDRTAPTVA